MKSDYTFQISFFQDCFKLWIFLKSGIGLLCTFRIQSFDCIRCDHSFSLLIFVIMWRLVCADLKGVLICGVLLAKGGVCSWRIQDHLIGVCL